MSNESEIETLIQQRGAVGAPRITPDDIDAAILSVHYCNGAQFDGERFPTSQMSLPCMTLCILVLKNGFMVTGESACASPANFDEEVGRKVAYGNARAKIWALEGYRLRNEMALVWGTAEERLATAVSRPTDAAARAAGPDSY